MYNSFFKEIQLFIDHYLEEKNLFQLLSYQEICIIIGNFVNMMGNVLWNNIFSMWYELIYLVI